MMDPSIYKVVRGFIAGRGQAWMGATVTPNDTSCLRDPPLLELVLCLKAPLFHTLNLFTHMIRSVKILSFFNS